MISSGTIQICGHSDDNVGLQGPGVSDEILSYEDPVHLALSDGTVLSMEYGNDGWKATIVERGTATIDIVEATDPEGSWPEYTDQVTIGPVSWIERRGTPDTDGDDPPVSRWEFE